MTEESNSTTPWDTGVSVMILMYHSDVDLAEPGLAFSGSLTMPVLRALDGRSLPASAAQIARTVVEGTPAGIRRSLERLSQHGICNREQLGGRSLYSLNYEHVLYQAVRAALEANDLFVKRLRDTLSSWEPHPVAGVLFGSAARRGGDIESDIDVLLIRPKMSSTVRKRSWAPQVHDLRTQVHSWSGNHLQALDWTESSLRRFAARREALIDEIRREGVTLYGRSVSELLKTRQAP
jgi:hypothetical protein